MSTQLAPTTMTAAEQTALLRVTKEHRLGFRDHILYSIALATGLREFELEALDVGDIYIDPTTSSKTRAVVRLRVFKGAKREDRSRRRTVQEVHLPNKLRYKLEVFWRYKKRAGESLEPDAPLFISKRKRRLSKRMMIEAFHVWQARAGLSRRHNFHVLRHTALTNLYRLTRDIRVVQRQARHANIDTTTIYAEPSDEDMSRAVDALPC